MKSVGKCLGDEIMPSRMKNLAFCFKCSDLVVVAHIIFVEIFTLRKRTNKYNPRHTGAVFTFAQTLSLERRISFSLPISTPINIVYALTQFA